LTNPPLAASDALALAQIADGATERFGHFEIPSLADGALAPFPCLGRVTGDAKPLGEAAASGPRAGAFPAARVDFGIPAVYRFAPCRPPALSSPACPSPAERPPRRPERLLKIVNEFERLAEHAEQRPADAKKLSRDSGVADHRRGARRGVGGGLRP
jgi:hypothetical protein